MGLGDIIKAKVKQKGAEIVNNATHATCIHCNHTDTKVHFKKMSGLRDSGMTCKNAAACRKRREKNASGGTVRHRRGNKRHPGSLPIDD